MCSMEPPLTPVQLPTQTCHQDTQLHVIPRSPIAMGGIKLQMLKPGDDPEEFLRTFEYVEGALWPKDVWAAHLGSLLTGEALAIYQALPHDTAEDYDTLKEALLDHLGVSERSYQRKFRSLAFTEGAIPRELAQTLYDWGRRWLKPDVRSPDEIVEIIVVEQFLQILPPGAIEWISQHLVSASLDIVVQLVESYFAREDAEAPNGGINADAQIPSQEGEQQSEAKEESQPSDDADDGDGFYNLDFEAPEEYAEPGQPTTHQLGDAQVSEASINVTVRGEGESYFTLDLGAYEEAVEDAREQLRDNEGESQERGANNCHKLDQPEKPDLPNHHGPSSDPSTNLLGASADMTYQSFSAAAGEEVLFLPQTQINLEGAWTAWREPQGVTAVEDSLDKDLNPSSQEELQTQLQGSNHEKSSDNGILSTLSFELKLSEETCDSDVKEPDVHRELNQDLSCESEVKSGPYTAAFQKQGKSVRVNGVNAQPYIVEVPHQQMSLSDGRVARPPFIVEIPHQETTTLNNENSPPFIVKVSQEETSFPDSMNVAHCMVETPQQERSSLDNAVNALTFKSQLALEGRSSTYNGANATPFVSVLPQKAVLSADSVVDMPPFMLELLQQVGSSGASMNSPPFIMQLPQQQRSTLGNGVSAPPFIVQLPPQQRSLSNGNLKTASIITECLKKNIPSRYVGVNASVYKIELPQELRSSLESGDNAPTFQLELPADGGLSCDSGVKTLAFVIECPKEDQSFPDGGVNLPALQFELPQQNRVACNSLLKTSPAMRPKSDKPLRVSTKNATACAVIRPHQDTSTTNSLAARNSVKIKVGIPHEEKLTRDTGVKGHTSKLSNKVISSYVHGGRAASFEAELPIKKRSTYESGVKTSRFRTGLSNQSKLSCNSIVKAPAPELHAKEAHQLSYKEAHPVTLEAEFVNQEKTCDNGTKAQTIKTEPDGEEIIDFDNEVMILAFEIEVPYQETSTCGGGVKRPASFEGYTPDNKYLKGYHEEYPGDSDEHETAPGKVIRKAHYRVRRDSDSYNDEWTPRNQRKPPGRKRRKFSTGAEKEVTTRTAKIHTQDRPYACNDCGASFRRKSTLRMHQRSHKSSKPYECTECGKSFRKQTTLGVHMKSHQTSGSRVCSFCGMNFRRLGNLYKHEKRHASDQLCTIAESGTSVAEETLPPCFESDMSANEGPEPTLLKCGLSFSVRPLSTHAETGQSVSEEELTIIPESRPSVSEEILSLIPGCGPTNSIEQMSTDQEIEDSLGEQFTLVTDQTVELMTNEYECDECGETFPEKSDLTMHEVTHAEEKPYACTKCERAFSLMASLNKHMRVHIKEVHSCDDCGLEFSRKVHLYRHQQTHVREKVFPCEKCGKCFNLRSQLVKHQQMENLFKCSQCGQGFSQYSLLSAHELTHAGENPFLCCECGQSFPDPTSFIKHHKMHPVPKPYACTECGRRFSKETYLIEHMKKKKEHKPFKNVTK